MNIRHYGAAALVVLLTAAGLIVGPPQAAVAANGAFFDPGYIVSDEVFFNAGAVSEADVQTFVQARGVNCRSTPGSPGCLREYRLNTPTRAADRYCNQYTGAMNEGTANVIYRVGRACGINPQALLVLLEKESSLVTRNNPSATNYKIAAGYACPDTAACDEKYYGFFNQVYSAARQFKIYALAPTSFRYRAGQNNTIQWHPTASCGSSTVFIQNKATAGLYNYTPYRPNQAALSNLYGFGDSCSSYGNRNFWSIFSDWFGSPTLSKESVPLVRSYYQDVLNRQPTDAETLGWAKLISGGTSKRAVANSFVGSDEYRIHRVEEAYRVVLRREPDPTGPQFWLGRMKAGDFESDDVIRTFYGTAEFYQAAGSNSNTGVVGALYDRILLRPATQAEKDGWAAVIAADGRDRVVKRIWDSPEAANTRVRDLYTRYLGRSPGEVELASWASYNLQSGDTATRNSLLESAEYIARALARFPS